MDITISSDNRRIYGSIWEKTGSNKVLIIAPAIGVSRHFYRTFAEYFSNLNYVVIAFDYHGMNSMDESSQDNHLKDWGEKDISSVISFSLEKYPSHKLFFVGHSIAGQLFPLAANCNQITSSCFIASQNVSFQNWRGIHRLKIYLFWNLIIPLFVRLNGKLPGYAYGGKYDLSATIAED